MAAKRRYRILSMDGGPSGPTFARVLREIERERPGFLGTVDMFAGTSDGATFSLSFAKTPKEDRNLGTIIESIAFNDTLFDAMTPTKMGLLRMIGGLSSADKCRRLDDAFTEHFKGYRTLSDLPGKVAIVSFRVRQPWGPKVYNNFGDERDDKAEVVDVVFQSGAFPVIIPLRQGHVDGGIFANHPGMCAIAQVLKERHDGDLDGVVNQPEDMIMFSLGGDLSRIGGDIPQGAFDAKMLEWGWIQWLAHLRSPALLMELMVNAGQRGTSFQCQQVLGGEVVQLGGHRVPEATTNYLRLAIPSVGLVKGMTDLILGRSAETLRLAEEAAIQWKDRQRNDILKPTIDQTLEWVDNHWIQDDIADQIRYAQPKKQPAGEHVHAGSGNTAGAKAGQATLVKA